MYICACCVHIHEKTFFGDYLPQIKIVHHIVLLHMWHTFPDIILCAESPFFEKMTKKTLLHGFSTTFATFFHKK